MPEESPGRLEPRLDAAEARLASLAPGYLDRVRQIADRLAVHDLDGTDARTALVAVDDLAVLDLDAPTGSRLPMVPVVKKLVKKAVRWYLFYFGRQLLAFGQAVAHLGGILLDRIERTEATTAALRAEVAQLATRLEQLERRGPGPT